MNNISPTPAIAPDINSIIMLPVRFIFTTGFSGGALLSAGLFAFVSFISGGSIFFFLISFAFFTMVTSHREFNQPADYHYHHHRYQRPAYAVPGGRSLSFGAVDMPHVFAYPRNPLFKAVLYPEVRLIAHFLAFGYLVERVEDYIPGEAED